MHPKEEIAHEIARLCMKLLPDSKEMSLEEWRLDYWHQLSHSERMLSAAVLDFFQANHAEWTDHLKPN